MPQEYVKPRSLNEIIADKMAKDGFDPSTGRRDGKEKPKEDLGAADEGAAPKDEGQSLEGDQGIETPKEKPSAKPDKAEEKAGKEPEEKAEEAKGAEEGEDLDSGPADAPLKKQKENLLKDYQKKTTRLAQERKQVEQEREELITYRDKLVSAHQEFNARLAELERREAMVAQGAPAGRMPISEMTQEQKEAVYKAAGIEVDELTDPNVLKAIDFMIVKSQQDEALRNQQAQNYYRQQQQREAEIFISREAEDLKTRYAKLNQELKLNDKAEMLILAHLGNMRRNVNPEYSIEQATQDYISGGGTGTPDEGAFLEQVKKSPHYQKLASKILEDARNAKGNEPLIPSSRTGGLSAVTPPSPPERQKFTSIADAAARAQRDYDANNLRHRR